MTIRETIENKIVTSLQPVHLEVINESHMHNVPPGSESHFKVVVVCDQFEGISRVKRHQTLNGILSSELKNDIHALSLQIMTASEWASKGGKIMASPQCLGGSKAGR